MRDNREESTLPIDEYSRMIPELETCRSIVEKRLRTMVYGVDPFAVVQSRVKSVSSVAGKIVRKYGECANPLGMFTDLCGFRVIASNGSCAKEIVSMLGEFFSVDTEKSVDWTRGPALNRFGYSARHVVAKIPEELLASHPSLNGVRIEIQVKTILEYAWDAATHETVYKGKMEAPSEWKREASRLAAVLEEADMSIDRFAGRFAVEEIPGVCEHLPCDMERELVFLLASVENETSVEKKFELSLKAVPAMKRSMRWGDIVDILSDAVFDVRTAGACISEKRMRYATANLGYAMCRLALDGEIPDEKMFDDGFGMLGDALSSSATDDARFLHLLGDAAFRRKEIGGCRDMDALGILRRAIAFDDKNPWFICAYETARRASSGNETFSDELENIRFEKAAAACLEKASLGVSPETSYITAGRLFAFAGKSIESILAYLEGFGFMKKNIQNLEAARRAAERERTFAENFFPRGLQTLLFEILSMAREPSSKSFETGTTGTFFSGKLPCGTDERARDIVGYLFTKNLGVEMLPSSEAKVNAPLYSNVPLPSEEKSLAMDLEKWKAVFSGGTAPEEIRLISCGNSVAERVNCMTALLMNVETGIVDVKPGSSEGFLRSPWNGFPFFRRLVCDTATMSMFVVKRRSGENACIRLDSERILFLAKKAHERYLKERTENTDKLMELCARHDPALKPWDTLPEALRTSNVDQVERMLESLDRAGFAVVPPDSGTGNFEIPEFTKRDIEVMAENEHGRWNMERIREGWTYGETKNVVEKKTPCLVSWDELSEEYKEYDRNVARSFPELLRYAGYGVKRVVPGEGFHGKGENRGY